MTKPAPPLATLVPTAPIPVLEVVDKALLYNKEERWADARTMQRAIRDAYQAITGMSSSSVRLSFDDEDNGVAHADTVVLSTKVPTSLTAAHDSALFPRKAHKWTKVAWLLTLGGFGVGGYYFLTQRDMTVPSVLSPQADGGTLASEALDLLNSIAPAESSATSATTSPESVPPSRVEAPPPDEPEGTDDSETTAAPAESASAAARAPDDIPAPAPRAPPAPTPAPRPASTTPPSVGATKPATNQPAATHKAAPRPAPPPPVKKRPAPPPAPPRPYQRP